MHQPSYRTADGEYREPWVYLHAIKDYADMAWHLEHVEGARASVSLSPLLLEQLDDYAAQFADGAFRDPLLRALQRGDADAPEARRNLSYMLCRANYERMVRRYPSYERLFHLAETAAWGGAPLSPADLVDTLVWYHLVWFGEATRRDDRRVHALISKAGGFDASDRATLLALIGDLVSEIGARYQALAHAGRIELCTTPYSHPILPLLIDFATARESRPQTPLPSASYPGGPQRVDAQLASARAAHAARFGVAPAGCWPSEGGISVRALEALRRNGFVWAASGEVVLANSVRTGDSGAGERARYLYTPYAVQTDAGPIACFFRDDDLSDRIGFVYAPWNAGDAVDDLTRTLESIAAKTQHDRARVVTIILDGENAWEHYAQNAFEFLNALYRRLGSHERLRLTTFSDALARIPELPQLDRIVAGSWVFGTFETWVGDPDKNRGWDLLSDAKRAYDATIASGALDEAGQARAEMLLRRCESSDWFWWFGGYNPPAPVRDFERLFRRHLRDLYSALGLPAPAQLQKPVSIGTGAPVYDGVMRQVWQADPA
ncbi:MAG: glycoside hydrolase [Candidatus Eremiobacteraeota bacterium]|nr:glycoside hydrolase [Candidatus Eremiobacteraeota bacterium]